MAYAPTLTATIDSNPCPRVLVAFTSLAAGTQTINVYRTAEGRRFKVRGGVNLFAVGGASVMDFECPFQTAASYQAEQFNASGVSLGFTDAASITLAVTQTWIHQPLSPTLAVTAKILMDSANEFSRPAPGGTEWPEGAVVGTLIGGQRRGLTQMSMHVKFGSIADLDEFSSMLGGYTTNFPAVLCVRTPGPAPRIPRLLFASFLDAREVIGGVNRLLTVQATVDEVTPPAPGIIIPTLRRADLDVAYATRGAGDAAYSTRGARDSDYTKAGLAG